MAFKAYKDFREFIATLEQEGEVQRIKEEVDWNLELGAITRRANEAEAPSPFFENIKDYPGGRVFGAPAAPSARDRYHARIALSLGLPPETGPITLIEAFAKGLQLEGIKPRLVKTGPCKENIQVGEEVNLLKFPIPYVHANTGGRMIGLWHTVITRDPDTGWTNWGMYRMQVHDEKTTGMLIDSYQHIGMHYYEKYEARNQPMPCAVVMGNAPLIPLSACFKMPPGVDEVDVIGAMQGEPVELVKCETVDLEVPATSEIVLEGYFPPHERKDEGPLPAFSGVFRRWHHSPKPVFKITAITHRNDPILPICCQGTVPTDQHLPNNITGAAAILNHLRNLGLPIEMAYIPSCSAIHIAIITTWDRSPGLAQKIADAIWGLKTGWVPKIMIVAPDIDITNLEAVFWAFLTRNHPGTGILKSTILGNSIWGFLHPEDMSDGKPFNTTGVIFDCRWPEQWAEEDLPVKANFDVMWPKEIQEKVLSKWEKYGYKPAPYKPYY